MVPPTRRRIRRPSPRNCSTAPGASSRAAMAASSESSPWAWLSSSRERAALSGSRWPRPRTRHVGTTWPPRGHHVGTT
eukprot:436664-Prymnesium_polylepis.1